MSDNKPQVPQAVQSCHELIAWMVPKIDQFPRNQRFTLGDRIYTRLLDVLELLIEAAYTTNKRKILNQANHCLAVVRHLWRLCLELKVINHKAYGHGGTLLVDLGKQVGGWQKKAAGRVSS